MRILIIGFITFLAWSAVATYIYVCKIKGLCEEPMEMQITESNMPDTMAKPIVPIQVNMPEQMTVYFAFDKSDFDADSNTDKYFNESTNFLNQNTQAKLSITGHTDAIGTMEYNQSLGYRRAQSVQQFFESKGMAFNKIEIVSKGENEPADDNNTAAGRANNRRTTITIKK